MKNIPDFVICICTYKRAESLFQLLDDISLQTVQPVTVIIVDGDPSSGEILNRLLKSAEPKEFQVIYIPSNHANLAYQRYLGWRISQKIKSEILLYFDDDIRLMEITILDKIMLPFRWQDKNICAVTSFTISGKNWTEDFTHVNEKTKSNGFLVWLLSNFGNTRDILPGDLSPTGNRMYPIEYPLHPEYGQAKWMLGRIMAFRKGILTQSSFTDDLFALTHIHCGLGEDTYLSRQIFHKGEIACALSLNIEHPGSAPPNSYPIKAYQFGYASAYSRRFLNDHYRGINKPKLTDRIALFKTYFGNNLLNVKTFFRPSRHRIAYVWGYFRGSVRGLLQSPIAKNLTPGINWWQDAEEALASQVVIE